MNLDRDYVRLNEFPEWFVADENTLYRIQSADGSNAATRLGAELVQGIDLTSGDWIIEPVGRAPYAR